MNWKTTCHYETGVWHKKHNLPCQDYTNYIHLDNIIVGAIADGAGTAKYADIGARLAVDTILKSLELLALKPSGNFSVNRLFGGTEKKYKNLFCNVIRQKVIPTLEQQAQEKRCSLNDFACTLIAFIATSNWIAAMQIGDGFLVIRLNQGEYQLLLKPNKGEFINETTFVTSKKALSTLQFKFLSGNTKFICASTDGLEKVAIRLSDWTPHAPFFKPLEFYLEQTTNPESNKQYLVKFLNSERLNSRTNDDKTLLLCLNDSV